MTNDIDIFIYSIVLILTLLVVFQYIELRTTRDRVTRLENMLKDIQTLVLRTMPDEE